MKFSTALLAASFAAGLGLCAIVVFRQAASTPADMVGPERPDPSQNAESNTGTGDIADSKSRSDDAASAEGLLAKGEEFWAALHDVDPKKFESNLRRAGLPDHVISALLAADARERARARSGAGGQTSTAPLARPTESGRFTTPSRASEEYAQYAGPLSRTLDFIDPSRRAQAQAISREYEALIREIRRGGSLITDAEKQTLAQLENERRDELKTVLSPQELADYEMLMSPLYSRLAYETSTLKPTLEEFRAIYALNREYSDRFGGSGLSNMPPRREDWEAARQLQQRADDQLLLELGTDRFAEYDRSRNYEYRELAKLVRRVNLPDTQAAQVFSMRDYVSTESNRIYNDSTLTPPQKLAELHTLAGSVRQQIHNELGNEAGTAYLRLADKWLVPVEQGSAVTFDRTVTRYRPVRGANVPLPLPPSSPPGG